MREIEEGRFVKRERLTYDDVIFLSEFQDPIRKPMMTQNFMTFSACNEFGRTTMSESFVIATF